MKNNLKIIANDEKILKEKYRGRAERQEKKIYLLIRAREKILPLRTRRPLRRTMLFKRVVPFLDPSYKHVGMTRIIRTEFLV